MGDELKVSFGTYEGSQNGWNAYLSLCSDGVLLYTDNFIVNYEALSGKKAPNVATELNDAVIQEYANNVDMYNSLLVCGNPIVYFEIDYTVTVGKDDKDNHYEFNFNNLRVINTISGKTTQTKILNIKRQITMKPMWDLREFAGIVEKQKAKEDSKKYLTESYMVEFGLCKVDAESKLAAEKKAKNDFLANFVKMPNKNYSVMKTEVTQKLYESIMGKNPSVFKGENNPVENVSWYDAVEFCNLLSKKFGYEPVYTINGSSVTWNENANGYRLSAVEEWQYAAKGGQEFKYSGSDNLDEVGWYGDNSGSKTHQVAQKKPNGYGLYDMSGNVWEWCWDSHSYECRYNCGGSWSNGAYNCEVGNRRWNIAYGRGDDRGFRIVRSTGK